MKRHELDQKIYDELAAIKLNEIAALNTFQDIKTFLLLIQSAMEEKGNKEHQFYKIAQKLDVSVRALEQHYDDNQQRLAKMVRFGFND
jgi:transcriptional regulator GlxA family with amidase domain